MGRWGKRIGLAVLGLLLAEAGARAFVIRDGCIGWRPLPPFGAAPHPRQRQWLADHLKRIADGSGDSPLFDSDLGWTWIRPGVAEPGLDREARGPGHYAPEKPAGVRRIACLGDSFTFCADVADEDAWPRVLETTRPGTEVLNLGVPGYGTDQALLRLRKLDPGLRADVAILGLMLENIGRNVNRYRPLWHPTDAGCLAKPRFTVADGNLRLVPLPYDSERKLILAIASGEVLDDLAEHEHWRDVPPMGLFRHSALARIAGGWYAYRAREARRLWDDPEAEPARVTLAIAKAFRREATGAGARFAPVLILPGWPDVQELAAERERYWKWVVDELERDGIDVIDPADALAASTLPLRSSDGNGTLYGGGGHFAPEGNRIVAGVVASWIDAHLHGR